MTQQQPVAPSASPFATAPGDFGGLRVLIFGLGRFGGGSGAARFFGTRGAEVTVTDRLTREDLSGSMDALEGVPITRWRLGEHREEDFESAEWVVVNPAIPPSHPLLERARLAGARLVTEVGLFLRWCPTPWTAGITGSNGKSTTTRMVVGMLRESGYRVHEGGNIGRSLLPEIDTVGPEDRVVLELSSFQLARFGRRTPRPAVVAVTELSANHLDWHGGEEPYRAAKQEILGSAFPHDTGPAVLPAHQPWFDHWTDRARKRGRGVVPFGCDSVPGGGVGFDRGALVHEIEGSAVAIAPVEDLPLRGPAQRGNIACAAAVAMSLGASPDGLRAGLRAFDSLPHRQQLVATARGIRFVNDSKATTAPAACCALAAESPGVVLLAGGRAKGASFEPLERGIRDHARVAILYGEAAEEIESVLGDSVEVLRGAGLAEAFDLAVQHARKGDTVLLSPACASFDEFENYEARGEAFATLARAWCHATERESTTG